MEMNEVLSCAKVEGGGCFQSLAGAFMYIRKGVMHSCNTTAVNTMFSSGCACRRSAQEPAIPAWRFAQHGADKANNTTANSKKCRKSSGPNPQPSKSMNRHVHLPLTRWGYAYRCFDMHGGKMVPVRIDKHKLALIPPP